MRAPPLEARANGGQKPITSECRTLWLETHQNVLLVRAMRSFSALLSPEERRPKCWKKRESLPSFLERACGVAGAVCSEREARSFLLSSDLMASWALSLST